MVTYLLLTLLLISVVAIIWVPVDTRPFVGKVLLTLALCLGATFSIKEAINKIITDDDD
jgi:hypothetical protein